MAVGDITLALVPFFSVIQRAYFFRIGSANGKWRIYSGLMTLFVIDRIDSVRIYLTNGKGNHNSYLHSFSITERMDMLIISLVNVSWSIIHAPVPFSAIDWTNSSVWVGSTSHAVVLYLYLQRINVLFRIRSPNDSWAMLIHLSFFIAAEGMNHASFSLIHFQWTNELF